MLGTGVVNIVNMFRPHLILLGGTMSAYAEDMIETVREMMIADCFGGANGMAPEIAAAEPGSHAGICSRGYLTVRAIRFQM